ncbi:hypothetical protein B0H17DRAFT_1136162 [Mycena rosella]|uniref:Uncharacterized protein n=1 Tax=Mycena rosella TaxID=1033263 RepID=A0AAD7DBA6_MYCRO|nr:hypothetical protein B0H17DRAFT_1136162 [Mycena rosella]
MPPHPLLELLRKGLSRLKQSVKTRKDDLMARSEFDAEMTLDDLELHGVLQKRNPAHRQDLVDVPEEQVPEDATDEDIAEAVQKMHKDRQDIEINGGDNHGGPALEPKPTRKEALQAISTLQRYL